MIELYKHQIAALEQTKESNKVAYYLDMGLGKTFVGSEKMKELGAKVNLIVCQKSKVEDWLNHLIEQYSKNDFEYIIDGTKNASLEFFIRGSYKSAVCVINYDLIFRRPELAELKDFTLMLDESSLIQNETSKRSKFILKLNPSNVILLSGTPTGGKYEKLWSQCKLLGWKISKSLFWSQYVRFHVDTKNGFPITIIDGYKNVERLKSKLREHGVIFMKSDEVFDLPAQIDNRLYCKTPKEYRKFRKDSIVIMNDIQLVGDTTLTKMMYERQLCGQYNVEKIKAFQEVVESTDDRIIVFYNFNEEKRLLIDVIDRPLSIVSGDTKDLSAYENYSNSITLIQYQAGAMGLNLQKANKIVYFTPPLGSEIFEQSKKRIHRIGQNKPCFYYYLICRNSIEERIYKTLAVRKDYTDRLFESEEDLND